MSALRQRIVQRLLADPRAAVPGVVYHRGELARDKVGNPGLGDLAEDMLRASDGRFDVVSKCGHVRSCIVGTGHVRLVTGRHHGEGMYVAVRRAG